MPQIAGSNRLSANNGYPDLGLYCLPITLLGTSKLKRVNTEDYVIDKYQKFWTDKVALHVYLGLHCSCMRSWHFYMLSSHVPSQSNSLRALDKVCCFFQPKMLIFHHKTCLYNVDPRPLKPHFYIVKLGFTGVYIIFLTLARYIDCGYPLKLPHWGNSNGYPLSMF